MEQNMKILMVLTSHDQLGNTGRKTGFWLEEFAAPYYAFKGANAGIVLGSARGGQAALSPPAGRAGSRTSRPSLRAASGPTLPRKPSSPRRFASIASRQRISTP